MQNKENASGSEIALSKVLDWSDRSTSVLEMGAGGVLLEASDQKSLLAENLLQMVAEVPVLSLAIFGGCLLPIQMKFPDRRSDNGWTGSF